MPKHYRHWVEMRTLTRLRNVHDEKLCAGETCVMHNPTDHHMRTWPLHWREDRGFMERICPHGIGHPDPDHEPRWRKTGQTGNLLHGCCDCCSEWRFR